MLKQSKLPPDNFPDDFESAKFHNYKPSLKPGLRLWVRESGTQVFFAIFFPFLLICSVATAFILNIEQEPERVVVVITSEAIPAATIGGSFPLDADQQLIEIPAKIDNVIVAGDKHGYHFSMAQNVAWTIEVTSDGLDPIVTLYDPQGIAVATGDTTDPTDGVSIFYQPTSEGAYGLTIEGINTGTYTLSIMPVR